MNEATREKARGLARKWCGPGADERTIERAADEVLTELFPPAAVNDSAQASENKDRPEKEVVDSRPMKSPPNSEQAAGRAKRPTAEEIAATNAAAIKRMRDMGAPADLIDLAERTAAAGVMIVLDIHDLGTIDVGALLGRQGHGPEFLGPFAASLGLSPDATRSTLLGLLGKLNAGVRPPNIGATKSFDEVAAILASSSRTSTSRFSNADMLHNAARSLEFLHRLECAGPGIGDPATMNEAKANLRALSLYVGELYRRTVGRGRLPIQDTLPDQQSTDELRRGILDLLGM